MLTIILGVIAFASPYITGIAVTILVGAMLALSGITRTIGAFKADTFQTPRCGPGKYMCLTVALVLMLRP